MTTRSNDILAGLLAECSDSILAGASVEACLERYPQHATALEPLLTTLVDVHELRAVPVRSSVTAAHSREQFMAAAMRLTEERRTPPVTWWERLAAWWAGIVAIFVPPAGRRASGLPVGLLAAMLVVILAGVLVTGGVTVSAKALPGDILYPIKTSSELVRLFIARDPMVRSGLEQEFSARRRHEAQAVAMQGRHIESLSLDGTLETISGNHWTVSGLDLTLDPAVQIIGDPVVGARLRCVLRAPGDGRLILLYVEVEDPAGNGAPAPVATEPTASPTRPAAMVTATATPTVEEPAASTPTPPDQTGQLMGEPEDSPLPEPTATATETEVPTSTPTAVPTATLEPTPTDTPPSREEVAYKIEGWVDSTEGNLWIINGTLVNVDSETAFIGEPEVGWKVSALIVQETDGSYTALQIVALERPEAPPEPVEFTDLLKEKSGEWWTVGSTPVRVGNYTTTEGDPQIGDLVSVKGERHQSEIWALRITKIDLTEYHIQGIISAVSGSSVVVDGYTVLRDNLTQIDETEGKLEVNNTAQVIAVEMPDGSLLAKVIKVLPPPPTPTPTPTRMP